MHDDLIERRLRAALRDEAGRLPFTITAAELERRSALGRRGGPRRLTLLLAAAVTIGVLGVGAAMGGLFDPPPNTSVGPTPATETPSPPPEASLPTQAPSTPFAPRLPDLDRMIADAAPATVVAANAHGSADGTAALPASIDGRRLYVGLATLDPDVDYEILFACIASSGAQFDIADVGGPTAITEGSDCPAATSAIPVAAAPVARQLTMRIAAPASWRVVVTRLNGTAPPALPEPPDLQPLEGEEELLRAEMETLTVGGSAGPPQGGLALYPLDAGIPPRNAYRVQLWCEGGEALRFLSAVRPDQRFIVGTTSQVPCDGNVHTIALGMPELGTPGAYIAATPGSRVAVLVTSARPPIAIVQGEPGWTLSSGFGPAFSFETETHSFTGLGGQDGGGPARVALGCAGVGTIEVEVELHAPMGDGEPDETFTAECTAGPSVTSLTFEDAEDYLTVTWTSAPEQWTALSILVPDP